MPHQPSSRTQCFARWARTRLVLAGTVASLLAGASGATNLFIGGSSWNTPGDWSLARIPASTDALFFDNSALGNNQLNASFTAQTLSFNTGSDSFGIDANSAGSTPQTLTLSGGTNANGGTDLISLSATTTGTITFGGNASDGPLTVAFGSTNGTINVANSAAKLVFGTNGHLTGNNGITKNGAGTLQILSTNSYAGGTTDNFGTISFVSGALGAGPITLNGGGLQWVTGNTQDISAQLAPIGIGGGTLDTNGNNVSFSTSLLGTGTVTKIGAGTLTLNGTSSTAGITLAAGTLALANPIALGSGTFTINGGTLSFGSLTNAFAGTLAGSGSLALTNSSSAPVNFTVGGNGAWTTYSGALSGVGQLTMNGAGTLTLSSDLSAFTGSIVVNQGSVVLANPAVSFPGLMGLSGGNLSFGNNVTSAALGGITGSISSSVLSTQNGLGAPVAVTVGAGNFPSSFSGMLTGNGSLNKVGTGSLSLSGNDAGLSGGITLTSGSLALGNPSALGTGTFTVNGGSVSFGTLTTLTAGALAGSGSLALTNTSSQPVTLTVGASGVSTVYSGTLSGVGTLVMNGTGTLGLSGSGSSGNIQLQAGTIDLSSNGLGLGSGPFTMNGGSVAFGTQTTAQAGALAGSGTLVLTNGNGQGVTFTVGGNGGSTTFSGAVTGLGTLVMNGAGTLTLGGQNSTAGITLNTGTITFSTPGSNLGTGTFTLNNAGNLLFGSQTIMSAGALAGNGSLQLINSGQPVTFIVGSNGASTTFSGILGGTGTLVMNGPGTLTLGSNDSAFNGVLQVNQGTVLLSTPLGSFNSLASLNGGSLVFGNLVSTPFFGALSETTATLPLSTQNTAGQPVSLTIGSSNFSTTFAGALTGNGTVIKTGTGIFTLKNPNSTAGITLSAGSIDISTISNALGTGTFTLNGGALVYGMQTAVSAGALAGSAGLSLTNSNNQSVTFTVGGNGANTTYSGSLTGFGTLVMNGSGTLGLSGTASTAGITLAAGTIDLSANGNALGAGPFTMNGGRLTFGTQTSASAGAFGGTGNLVLTNSASQGVSFTVGGNNFTSIYTGAVTGLGTLIKTGSGTLALSNANSTAGITLTAGTLDISASPNALGSGTFTFNGGSPLFGSLSNVTAGGLAGSANLSLTNSNGQAVTLTVGGNGAVTVYSGALTGFGALVVNGPGTLGLAGTGSTVPITLTAGTIDLSGSGTGLGTGLFTINGGALTFGAQTSASAALLAGSGNLVLTNASNQGVNFSVGQANATMAYSGALTGLGTLILNGSGVINLSNPNSTAGITVNGNVQVAIGSNGNALGTGTLTLNNGLVNFGSLTSATAGALAGSTNLSLVNQSSVPVTFTAGSNGASTAYSGSLIGSGTFVKVGAGTMQLSGTSTTDNITLAAGAIDLSANASALGTGIFTINGGALLFGTQTSATAAALAGTGGLVLTNQSNAGVNFTVGSNAIPNSYSGAITGLGTLTKVGSGILGLSNPNSTVPIILSAGTLDISANGAALGSGTLTLNGGTLFFGGLTSAAAGALSGSGALALTNNIAFTVGSNGASTTYSGAISGAGSLIKTGPGTLTLSTASSYTVGTVINGGAIVTSNVGPAASVFGTGQVSVGPAGLLTGAGTILGTTFVSGTLAAGSPIGVLNFTNTLSLQNTAQFLVTLGGGTPGTGYSQVFVENGITLNGNLNINFANGFTPTINQTFFILDTVNPGPFLSGTFSNVTSTGINTGQITVDNAVFQVNYNTNNTDGGANDVSLVYLGTTGLGLFTWSGAGADTNWSTAANWLGNAAPATNTFATQLIFAGSGTGAFLTPNNDTAFFDAGSLTFQAGTGNFVLSGQAINLGTNGLTSTRVGTETIGNNLVLQGSQTWSIGPGSTVVVTGNISQLGTSSLTKTGAGTLVLAGANTYNLGTIISGGTLQLGNGGTTGSLPVIPSINDNANLTFDFSGNVTQGTNFGPISGSGTVTQAGTGTVFLTNNSNTYSGGTIVTSGILNFQGATLGTGLITLNGGTLQWGTSVAQDLSSQLAPIGQNGGTLDTNGSNVNFGTNLSGAGTLIKAGAGTLTLDGSQSAFSGGFTLNAGGLTILNASGLGSGTFTINGGTLGFFSSLATASAGTLAGSGGIVLTNGNGQAVNLFVGNNGASTTYTGTLSGLGQLTMNGSGTLTLGGDSSASTSIVSIQQGTVALATPNAAAGYTLGLNGGTLSFGLLTSAAAGGLSGASPLVLTNAIGQAVTLSVGGTNTSSSFVGQLTGPGTLVKLGTGTLSLTNTSSTAPLTLSVGTLDLSGLAALQSTLTINGGSVGFGSQSNPSIGALAGSGGLVLTNALNQPVFLAIGGNGASTTYTGPLSGLGGLIKSGAGTFTIGGDSTGTTSSIALNLGTVALSTPNAAAGYNLSLNGGTFSFGSLTSAAVGGLSGSASLTLTNANNQAVTLTVGGNNSSSSFSGALIGTGGLVKSGTGTLSLNNSSSTASVTLTAGTLDLSGSASALGTSTLTLNGGTLNFGTRANPSIGALAGSAGLVLTNTFNQGVSLTVGGNGASTTYSGLLSGLGQLVMSGTGTLTLGGDSSSVVSAISLTQGTVALSTPNAAAGYALGLNGGTLSFDALTNASVGSLNGSGGLALTNASGLGVNLTIGANNLPSTYSGALTGLGTLVKSGLGPLTLSNAGSTAGITLNSGTLNVNANGGLGSGTVTLNSGTLNTNAFSSLGTGTFVINGGTLNFGFQTSFSLGALAGTGGLVLTNSNNQAVSLLVGVNGASTTYSGALSGLGSLVMGGTGTLTLAGNSTGSTSNLVLNQGTVALATPSAAAGYTLNLGNGALSFGNLTSAFAGALSGNVTLALANASGQPVTFTVGGNNATTVYTGPLTGAGTLVMNGTGALSLFNPSSTAAITLQAGTLSVGSNLALGGGPLTINGGSLNLSGISNPTSSALTINGGALNYGSLTSVQFPGLAGSGGLVLTNTNNQPVNFVIFNSLAITTNYAGAVSGLGTLNMSAPGTLTLSGSGSTAAITLSSGTIDLSANSNGLGTGLFTVNGGTLSFGTFTSASAGALAGSAQIVLANTLSQGVAFAVGSNNSSTTFAGTLVGLGSLVKYGTDTLTLVNPSTYSGGTNIAAGSVAITNHGNAYSLGTGPLHVGISGTLTGTGQIFGASNVDGTISPGTGPTSPGGLIFNSSLALSSTAQLQLKLDGPNAVSNYDQIVTNGQLTLGGNLNVSLLTGFTPTVGEKFFILDEIPIGLTITGTFANVTPNGGATGIYTIPEVATFLVNYADNNPADGNGALNDVSLTYQGIPEPSSLVSLLGGAAALLGWRRRRN